MDLSVIIVNYKSTFHVLNCLETVYGQTLRYSFEVIVVDNLSGDNSEQEIRSRFPEVVWLQMGYNAGFARANNAGMRTARGKNVLLLNADTLVLENALDKTLDLFYATSDAVGCGVQLLNPDGSHQISGAHFIKGGLNQLLPLPYLGRFVRFLGYRFGAKIPSVTTVTAKLEVDWIIGAFMLVRSDVLSAAGLMDEDFFMYAEEIEWCGRLRKNGRLYLFEEPKVIHLGGGTSSDYYATQETENGNNLWNKKARQIIISQLLRIRKQYGVPWFLLICAFFIVEIPVFIVGLLLEKLWKADRSRFRWSQVAGYIHNMGYVLKYFFRILQNKPFFYKVY